MSMEWYSLHKGGTGQIEEKKSRFIATLIPVTSEEEASAFIADMKKKYWDAKHNCSAFIIGPNGEKSRCSDDGEPSGTAGRPMLDALTNERVTNVCVVVTRYFGGTLLGTGGLVRAYSAAVKEGLAACTLIKKQSGLAINVVIAYNDLEKIQRLCADKEWHITDVKYAENVSMTIVTPSGDTVDEIVDATSGRAKCTDVKNVEFAIADGELLIY